MISVVLDSIVLTTRTIMKAALKALCQRRSPYSDVCSFEASRVWRELPMGHIFREKQPAAFCRWQRHYRGVGLEERQDWVGIMRTPIWATQGTMSKTAHDWPDNPDIGQPTNVFPRNEAEGLLETSRLGCMFCSKTCESPFKLQSHTSPPMYVARNVPTHGEAEASRRLTSR